jgi:hypothetical protein
MQKQATPILLYDGDCGVCRRVAHWVETSARMTSGGTLIMLMPVGHDPEVLKRLNPGLDIWDAYATNYLIMPDASMKTGGEAVAEVLLAEYKMVRVVFRVEPIWLSAISDAA